MRISYFDDRGPDRTSKTSACRGRDDINWNIRISRRARASELRLSRRRVSSSFCSGRVLLRVPRRAYILLRVYRPILVFQSCQSSADDLIESYCLWRSRCTRLHDLTLSTCKTDRRSIEIYDVGIAKKGDSCNTEYLCYLEDVAKLRRNLGENIGLQSRWGILMYISKNVIILLDL